MYSEIVPETRHWEIKEVNATVNIPKLRGLMVENGVSVELLAKRLGQNRSTVYRKLSNPASITVGDACKISELLELSASELSEIFFSA